jgi:putative PEP-CTERM system TPR-repeat lipoprotein
MRYAKQMTGWTRQLILALITLTLFACGNPEMDARQLVLTAKDYIAGNKIREAALELQNALQENPDNAEARYLLGQINLDVGDMAGAEKEFRRAASAGWKEEQAVIGLARALINSSAFQKMIDEVEIKDVYPATARANLYGLRAAAQAGLGQLEQARETLAAGAAIDANAFQVLKTTSQLQLVSGDTQGAASTLKQALTAWPDNPELMLLSAITAIQANDLAGAMAAYRNVIDQDSAWLITAYGRQARLGLARLQILDKDLEQAQSTLAPLFRRNANDPETNYLGGMLAFEQGNLDLAEERLLKVLKVAPDHAQTRLLFGTVSYAQKDYEQAAYYIAKYVSAVPENLGARKLLGRTYLILEQHDEAQAILQPGLRESTDDAELLALVGLSRLQGGNTASGIEGLEKAVKLAPDSATLRGVLAKAYLSSGDTDNAIKELNTILAEDGGQEQTETLLVLAHLRAGSTDQAIDAVLKMLARKPQDPAVLALVGIVFVVSEDRVEARKYFNKALQIQPGFVPATVSLARLEELEGNPEAATALYKGIVDSGAESVGPLLALARLAETRGKTEEMLDWLEKARKQAPGDIRDTTCAKNRWKRPACWSRKPSR